MRTTSFTKSVREGLDCQAATTQLKHGHGCDVWCATFEDEQQALLMPINIAKAMANRSLVKLPK